MADRDKYFSQKSTVNYNNGGDMIDIVNRSEIGNYNTYSFGDELSDDGLGFWSRIWNDLSGQTAQQKEFAQQEYLQDKMNEYNLPANQMARMKAAGINPNIAASGISNGGSESAQAPAVNTNTQGVQGAIGAFNGALDSVTGGLSNLASAQDSIMNAVATRKLLPYQAANLHSQNLLTLENIGLSRANAQAVSIMNLYKPMELQLGLARMRLELPMLVAQTKTINAQYEEAMANVDLMNQKIKESEATIDLMTYQKMSLQAQAAKAQAEAARTHQIFQMTQEMNWDPMSGMPGLIGGLLLNPNFSQDDLENTMDNLMAWNFNNARMSFLGSSGLGADDERSLFDLQKEVEGYRSQQEDIRNRNKEIYNTKYRRYEVGVGPISVR